MGVIIAKVLKKDEEPVAPEFIIPNERQRKIILETWEEPKKHLTDVGELLLFRYLDKHPMNQNMFEAFRNVPLLSLKVVENFLLNFYVPSNNFGSPGHPGISDTCRPDDGHHAVGHRLL